MALALSGSAAARALAQRLAPATTRGYAAAASSGAMRRGAAATADGKAAREAEKAAADSSWVPDPVTGHYRPANRSSGADPADLRAAHLGQTYARA
ncbi:hypothetical protein D1007_05564 [Hordeum vulgare]|uniref:Late embryogenesis abundant protein n=2 Tax=Hordeum vulgare TaxID=4513 RepID=A0A8I6XL73_HORVV|nr:late embryogenis abundant protein 41-like [Hordeum vulgare subsp. vulgare]KAE8816820.1 hypothetical protein D1007_05564 [Hordeum vulgare]KAI5006483.1 hypothetical protein ZWY2020_033726 [Hordeum vulgare]CAA55482.1 ORF1 [Hordeum vulgare subsp. vulgare]